MTIQSNIEYCQRTVVPLSRARLPRCEIIYSSIVGEQQGLFLLCLDQNASSFGVDTIATMSQSMYNSRVIKKEAVI